jgi:hypothetical protein
MESSATIRKLVEEILQLLRDSQAQAKLGVAVKSLELMGANFDSLNHRLSRASMMTEQELRDTINVAQGAVRYLTDSELQDDSHPLIRILVQLLDVARTTLAGGTMRWKATAGTTVLIGRPARPMSDHLTAILREVVEQAANVSFAYLPQMYIKGKIDPPRRVLFLVLRESVRGHLEQVMNPLITAIHAGLPKEDFIDVLPVFLDHEWLSDVIRTGTVLYVRDQAVHYQAIAGTRAV